MCCAYTRYIIQTENPGWMFQVFVCVSIYLFFLLSLSLSFFFFSSALSPISQFFGLTQRLRKFIFRSVSMVTDKLNKKKEWKWSWSKGAKANHFAYKGTKHRSWCAITENIACIWPIWLFFHSLLYIFENHSNAKLTQKTYTCRRMDNVCALCCVSIWVCVGERDFPWRFFIVYSISQIAIWYRFNWGGKTFWWFHHVWPIEFSFIFNDAWPNCSPSIQSTMVKIVKIHPSLICKRWN